MNNVLHFYKKSFPKIGQRVMIDASCVIIGDVIIADDVSIWPLVVIRGDENHITIGSKTNIQDGSVLHVTQKSENNPQGAHLSIGSDVTIGHNCILHGCTIGDSTLVGMGSIILDGAFVENNVIIGAGSLVPKNKYLQSGFLYFGNPIKKIRHLTENEILGLKQSAYNYVNQKNTYLANFVEREFR